MTQKKYLQLCKELTSGSNNDRQFLDLYCDEFQHSTLEKQFLFFHKFFKNNYDLKGYIEAYQAYFIKNGKPYVAKDVDKTLIHYYLKILDYPISTLRDTKENIVDIFIEKMKEDYDKKMASDNKNG